MKKNQIIGESFVGVVIVLVYTSGVAWIMQNGDRIFNNMANFFGPIAFLLLFTLSALIVGMLMAGRPAMRYIDGQKKEAVLMVVWNIVWLAVLLILALAYLAAR